MEQRDDLVTISRNGRVTTLTLNRPDKLNALSPALIESLQRALDVCEADDAVRVVVLTGNGRAFSAGADIAVFQQHVRSGPDAAVQHFLKGGQALTRRIESFRKPIIAMVNGIAFGGGCEITEACHVALASSEARFAKSEINLGIIPTFGGTQRLPRNVGRKAALELLLTGRPFDAEEALSLGLVNRVVAHASLQEETMKMALEIASKSSLALASTLHAVHRGMDASIDDGLAIEEAAFREVVLGQRDANEGIAAFVEKRKAKFA